MSVHISLRDKVIVVTGGTGILGDAFIKALSEAGAAVGILGRNEQVAQERANAIIQSGGRAMPLIADVTDAKQLQKVCDEVLSAYGKIDGLVNGAGGNIAEAVLQPEQDIFDLNIEALQKVMNINLFGSLLPTQIF